MTESRVALVTAPTGRAALVGADTRRVGPLADVVASAVALEHAERPRWVWWSAEEAAAPLVGRGVMVARAWDLAEVHRLLAGGWAATPQRVWAAANGLDPAGAPAPAGGDLFDFTGTSPADDRLVRDDGHLRPDAGSAQWAPDDSLLLAWAETALRCAELQRERLATIGPRAVATAHSESAAAILCLELARDGLPLDRAAAERLIAESAGPRPEDDTHARAIRAERDAAVLAHARAAEGTDLRNPAQVRDLLAREGVRVTSTRKHVLAPFRETHAVVEALLQWRRAERIATTYGYSWLDAHVGPDDRLRGRWTVCDGAAGRMTAQNGLHNLPTSLRPAVAAHAGHVLVRADLGQVEPRVLAVVSGDARFAEASRADDLYAPVASALGVERPVAKVAVLAAMYGQRSGAAGEALKGLERAYPVAMAHLDDAYAAGLRRSPLRTFGGRLIPLDAVLTDAVPKPAGGSAAEGVTAAGDGTGDVAGRDSGRGEAVDAARGRFARNAVIQGAAAELFKAWAATVRATTRDLGAQIVLCLHDELLVHVPEEHAEECRRRVVAALDDSARRWAGTTAVRFVADASVLRRWSEAKE